MAIVASIYCASPSMSSRWVEDHLFFLYAINQTVELNITLHHAKLYKDNSMLTSFSFSVSLFMCVNSLDLRHWFSYTTAYEMRECMNLE